MTFDPPSMDAYPCMDTLLLPVGGWTFYYPNGSMEKAGTYVRVLALWDK